MTPPLDPPANAVPRFSFELPPSADGASFAAFRQNSAATCEIGLREGALAADFWFSTTLVQLPRATLFKAAGAGHTARRGPEHIAQGDPQIAMFAFLEGRSETNCPGRTVSVGPGDVVIYDYGLPHDSAQTDYEAVILMVPRERVPAAFLAHDVHGAVLKTGSGAARLLHGMLVTLFESTDDLTVSEAEAAVDAVLSTARVSLHARTATEAGVSDGDVMDKALAFIDSNLADPALATTRLQAHLGLSRSSLYRLFEPEGGVRAAILRKRLDGCLRLLLSKQAPDQPWWKLAADHGFDSEAQLNRAFARRFGITPRAFYDMVSRKDHAGLTAQAQRAGFVTLEAWLDHVARADSEAFIL